MKNVCIATFCEWTSYGSVMQAIGLKEALSRLNLDSFIVRDVPAPSVPQNSPAVFSKNPRTLVKNLLDKKLFAQRCIAYQRAIRFIEQHMDVRYFDDYRILKRYPPEADYYLAGSDQVWHPAVCKPAFFLDFAPKDKPRLSYAASMGTTVVPEEKQSTFRQLLSGIDRISVREADMKPVIAQYADKDIEVHIDPSLLVNRAYWKKLAEEYPIGKPYILVYAIYWDKTLNKELKALHRRTGFEIVVLCQNGVSSVWATRKIHDAGPGQFLYLIDHAGGIVTSSFHGTAFGLNFGKKLAAVINPSAPSRISSLLDTLGVPRIPISKLMDFDQKCYGTIYRRLEEERARSMCYLKEIFAADE